MNIQIIFSFILLFMTVNKVIEISINSDLVNNSTKKS